MRGHYFNILLASEIALMASMCGGNPLPTGTYRRTQRFAEAVELLAGRAEGSPTASQVQRERCDAEAERANTI